MAGPDGYAWKAMSVHGPLQIQLWHKDTHANTHITEFLSTPVVKAGLTFSQAYHCEDFNDAWNATKDLFAYETCEGINIEHVWKRYISKPG